MVREKSSPKLIFSQKYYDGRAIIYTRGAKSLKPAILLVFHSNLDQML